MEGERGEESAVVGQRMVSRTRTGGSFSFLLSLLRLRAEAAKGVRGGRVVVLKEDDQRLKERERSRSRRERGEKREASWDDQRGERGETPHKATLKWENGRMGRTGGEGGRRERRDGENMSKEER